MIALSETASECALCVHCAVCHEPCVSCPFSKIPSQIIGDVKKIPKSLRPTDMGTWPPSLGRVTRAACACARVCQPSRPPNRMIVSSAIDDQLAVASTFSSAPASVTPSVCLQRAREVEILLLCLSVWVVWALGLSLSLSLSSWGRVDDLLAGRTQVERPILLV